MRDLQQLSRDTERERAEFTLEKSELDHRISTLESVLASKDKMIKDYLRRISLLEYALRSERARRDGLKLPALTSLQAEEVKSPMSGSKERYHSPESRMPSVDSINLKPRSRSCKQILRRYLQDILNVDESRISQMSPEPASPHEIDMSTELPTDTRLVNEWRPVLKLNCSLEGVRCVHSDPSARSILISGGDDGLTSIWNVSPVDFERRASQDDQEPEAVVTCRGHQGPVTTLSYLQGSNEVLTTGVDGTIRLWRIPEIRSYDPYGFEHEQPIKSESFFGHDDAIWAAKLKDRSLVTAGADGVVALWSLNTAAKPALVKESIFSLPGEIPTAIAWHPFDPRKVIVTFASSMVAIFDASTGQKVSSHPSSSSSATCAEAFTNFACISVGFRDGFVRTLDLNGGEWVSGFSAHPSVGAVALTESKYLASGGSDGIVSFWDLRNTSCTVQSAQLNNRRYDEGVTTLFLSERLLVAGGADGSVNYLPVGK